MVKKLGVPYTVNLSYNLAGDMTSLTYPSGRVVNYAYNSANRNTGVTFASFNGVTSGYQYLSMPQHFASGADYVSTFGNGISETNLLNNRLQGQQITTSNPALGTLSDLAYTFTDPVTGKNNGNVYSIADQLNSTRTQNFGYDQLNRLTSAQTSGTLWGNTYVIDAWGNLIQKNQITGKAAGEFLQVQADSTNRLIGYTYDAGGNMTNDGSHSFQFDADNQITTVNGTAATYSYGPDGQRVRKVVGSASSDYIYWHGKALGVWNGAADWSDYIFDAGGKRIARADNYEDRVLMQGTNCANCGWLYTEAKFHTGPNLTLQGYVIQSGDKLLVRQYQPSGVQGGLGLQFADGWRTWDYHLTDQDGQDGIYDTVVNTWHSRRFDLTQFAGKTVSWVEIISEGGTLPGPWSIYYQDFILLSADGTVHKIYSHDSSVTWDMWGTSGVTGRSITVDHSGSAGSNQAVTTTYNHGDHLGSARMSSGADGYPTWQNTYYPWGGGYNPQSTVTHYKFTGQERDGESGLDNFGARYYSNVTGRFMTPDWSLSPEPVPYADLSDPQSLNLYSYVRNNPLSKADADGHCGQPAEGSSTKTQSGFMLELINTITRSTTQSNTGIPEDCRPGVIISRRSS